MMHCPLTIPMMLEHGNKIYPKREIISILPDKTRHEYTYHDLYKRSKKLMYALVNKLNVKKGEMIGTFAWNHYQHLELYYGIPGAGAVCHTINIRLSAAQTEFIVNNAEDRFIFLDASLVPLIEPIALLLPTVEAFIILNAPPGFVTSLRSVMDYEELIKDVPDDAPWVEVEETAASVMCFTSGTTGQPKGVLYSHRSTCLHSIVISMPNYANITATDRWLVVVPQFHVMAWGFPFAGILSGVVMVLPSSQLQPESLVSIMVRERINKANGVPTIWQGVYSLLKKNNPGPDFPLKEFFIGGAAAPPSLIENFKKDFNIIAVHAWGMTEISPVGTISRLQPEHHQLSEKEKFIILSTQGQELPFIEIRTALENGETAPRDGKTSGEIQIRGAWVINAYFKSLGRENFSEDGWFKTGDVGVLNEEGYLQITDRTKDLIKSGGEWISSVALEVAIMAHPKVKESAVIAIPDIVWTERPLAVIVLKDKQEGLQLEDLHQFLSSSFAKYQLPDKLAFVEEIPKTSVGKFNKKEMRSLYAEGRL